MQCHGSLSVKAAHSGFGSLLSPSGGGPPCPDAQLQGQQGTRAVVGDTEEPAWPCPVSVVEHAASWIWTPCSGLGRFLAVPGLFPGVSLVVSTEETLDHLHVRFPILFHAAQGSKWGCADGSQCGPRRESGVGPHTRGAPVSSAAQFPLPMAPALGG